MAVDRAASSGRRRQARYDDADKRRAALLFLSTITERKPQGNIALAAKKATISTFTLRRWMQEEGWNKIVEDCRRELRMSIEEEIKDTGIDSALEDLKVAVGRMARRIKNAAEIMDIDDVAKYLPGTVRAVRDLLPDEESLEEQLATLPEEALLKALRRAELELEEATRIGDSVYRPKEIDADADD